MDQTAPNPKDLAKASKKLKERQFLYISSFADMLNRFQEAVLKVPLRFSALSYLIRKGGSLTPTQLAQLMLRSKHSITIIIDSLEKEGYVIRVRDKHDRRMVHIKLTQKGLEHVSEKVDNENPVIVKLMSCLDEDEREQMVGYVKRMRKALIAAMNENQGG